jgi:glycine reductase complex component B subunit gamma
VITKEFDRMGMPIAIISAMYPIAEQVGASRIVKAVSIPHPCGDPSLPAEVDARLRREIVETAFKAIQSEVKEPTLFDPSISTSG